MRWGRVNEAQSLASTRRPASMNPARSLPIPAAMIARTPPSRPFAWLVAMRWRAAFVDCLDANRLEHLDEIEFESFLATHPERIP
jgi:hypothetical protein